MLRAPLSLPLGERRLHGAQLCLGRVHLLEDHEQRVLELACVLAVRLQVGVEVLQLLRVLDGAGVELALDIGGLRLHVFDFQLRILLLDFEGMESCGLFGDVGAKGNELLGLAKQLFDFLEARESFVEGEVGFLQD